MVFKDFFRPREKFLLLEIAPRQTSGLLIGVDENKNIYADKFWENFSFGKLRGDPLKNLRKRQVIVSAHPEFVTTVSCPALLVREKSDAAKPISLAELESLFSQALSKLIIQERGRASVRLGLDELDTIIVGAKACNFKIDGHSVLNPLGFVGKEIGTVLELSFTSRHIFEDLKDFFKAREGFFFTGSARSALFVLSRLAPPPTNFLFADGDGSFLFSSGGALDDYLREQRLGWRLDGVFEAISSALNLSPAATFGVYDRFLKGEASDKFIRSMENILKSNKNLLFEEVKKISPSGKIYIHSAAPLPFKFPFKQERIVLEELPLDTALDRFGFRLAGDDWFLRDSETFMRLAPFFEFYFDKSDLEINQRLRRRLHWLIQ